MGPLDSRTLFYLSPNTWPCNTGAEEPACCDRGNTPHRIVCGMTEPLHEIAVLCSNLFVKLEWRTNIRSFLVFMSGDMYYMYNIQTIRIFFNFVMTIMSKITKCKGKSNGKRKPRNSPRVETLAAPKKRQKSTSTKSASGRTSQPQNLQSAKKMKGVAMRTSKSKLGIAPNPPKSAPVKISMSDLKLLGTYNRKDEHGKTMNPPAGTSKIVKKVIRKLIESYDDHVRSEAARKQLVFLRIGHTQRLSMNNEFPDKSDFTRLLTFLSEQYDSGGSDRAHWIIYNLAGPPSRKLMKQNVVDSPLWERFQNEMGDPTHWFLYIMTLVVIHRYAYVKAVFGSSFKDSDVEELVETYVKDLKREEDRMKWWDSRSKGSVSLQEQELKQLRKEIQDLKFNIDNAKRITQK